LKNKIILYFLKELTSVQAGGKFVVAECDPEWSASIHVTGGSTPVLNVLCGETFDIPSAANLKITSITTTPCSVADGQDLSGNSHAVAEAIDDGQFFDEFAADQAVADDLVGDEQFDAAVGDVEFTEAFDEQFVDQSVDQFADQLAVDEFAADQAVAEQTVDQSNIVGGEEYVDQSVDQFAADQAVADDLVDDAQNVDQFAVDQAVADFVVTESAVYDEETDFVADGNIDAAFAGASFSVDQSVDLAVADTSADQFVDESFSDADQLDDQFVENY